MKLSNRQKIWCAAILYWLIFGGLAVYLYPVTITDAASRYAPMADAFARGEWFFAFHPRFGVSFQVLSGIVSRLTGLSGDCSIQLVASGFLAFSAVPLWCLMHKVFDRRIAWWSVALLFVADDFTRYAMDGLRDPVKILAFALIGWGWIGRQMRYLALGIFFLITTFAYGYVIGSVFLFVWVHRCIWIGRGKDAVLPLAGWFLGTAVCVVMLHAYTGHWLPILYLIPVLGGVL